MRRWLWVVGLVLWLVPAISIEARRAISIVQSVSEVGNDVVVTFGAAPASTNHVVIATIIQLETNTISITGWTPTVNTLMGPVDSAGFAIRAYLFCTTGDDADTSFTATTSGSNQANVFALEMSGGSCTMEDSDSNDTDPGAMAHSLTTDLTTTAGSLVVGWLSSATGATYTKHASYTLIADVTAEAAAQYLITAGGSDDPTWTSSANEDALVLGASILAAGVAPTCRGALSLLGVGGC